MIQCAAEEAIIAGIDTLIFVTGRNKRAIEDHFDSNYELEKALGLITKYSGKYDKKYPSKRCRVYFCASGEQLGLGHAILCAQRAVGNEPFAVLLADDFLTDHETGVTADLIDSFESSGKTQISVMHVKDEEVSKYGIVVPGANNKGIKGLIEKPREKKHRQIWLRLDDIYSHLKFLIY